MPLPALIAGGLALARGSAGKLAGRAVKGLLGAAGGLGGKAGRQAAKSAIRTGVAVVKHPTTGKVVRGTAVAVAGGAAMEGGARVVRGKKRVDMSDSGVGAGANPFAGRKRMNVLNPRALRRAQRRVEGFHSTATKALKQMEKWARKAAPQRRGGHAPVGGKKRGCGCK